VVRSPVLQRDRAGYNRRTVGLSAGRWCGATRADIYNILNPDTILRRRDNYGASFDDVDEVILGRFWKFLTQLNF